MKIIWLVLLTLLGVHAVQLNQIVLYSRHEIERVVNSDIATHVVEFLNPEFFTMNETFALFPPLESIKMQSFVIYRLIFSSQTSTELSGGKLYTLHVTGDDRNYLDATIEMDFSHLSGECQDMGIFVEDSSQPRVLNRMDSGYTVALGQLDMTLPLKSRIALFIPTSCSATMNTMSRSFDMTEAQSHESRDPLEIQTTGIFPSKPRHGVRISSLSRTKWLFPDLEIDVVRRNQPLVYKYLAVQPVPLEFHRAKYLTFPAIGQEIIKFQFEAYGPECDQVKLYKIELLKHVKLMMQTPHRYVSHPPGSNRLELTISDKDQKSNGYHLYIPKNCRLSIVSIRRQGPKLASKKAFQSLILRANPFKTLTLKR